MNPSLRRQSVSSAARVRRFRERKKRHGMMLMIEVPAGLPDALVESGYLQEWNAENPIEIRRAIERILAQLATM
jgi:hypothetical protein